MSCSPARIRFKTGANWLLGKVKMTVIGSVCVITTSAVPAEAVTMFRDRRGADRHGRRWVKLCGNTSGSTLRRRYFPRRFSRTWSLKDGSLCVASIWLRHGILGDQGLVTLKIDWPILQGGPVLDELAFGLASAALERTRMISTSGFPLRTAWPSLRAPSTLAVDSTFYGDV